MEIVDKFTYRLAFFAPGKNLMRGGITSRLTKVMYPLAIKSGNQEPPWPSVSYRQINDLPYDHSIICLMPTAVQGASAIFLASLVFGPPKREPVGPQRRQYGCKAMALTPRGAIAIGIG